MTWRRHFAAYAASTDATPEDARRVVERVAEPRGLVRTYAREPAPGATGRLLGRLREPRPRAFPWKPILAAGMLVAAGLLLVAWPSPAPLRRDLVATDEPRVVDLTREVHAEFRGNGRVEGTASSPRLRWETGTLSLDVAPHRGIDLTVETAEGTVRVVGTAFTVYRDALGTAVHVERGEVAVQCVGEPVTAVRAGERALCLPTRAVGMLTRAQRLSDLGAEPQAVLDSVARGLRLASPGDPAIGELLALRVEVLLRLGRVDEARRDAARYLALGGPRAEEIRDLLATMGPGGPGG